MALALMNELTCERCIRSRALGFRFELLRLAIAGRQGCVLERRRSVRAALLAAVLQSRRASSRGAMPRRVVIDDASSDVDDTVGPKDESGPRCQS